MNTYDEYTEMYVSHLVLILSPSSHMLGACHRCFLCPALSLVFCPDMSAIIHGWYRHTDILWAWYTILLYF